LKKKYGRGGGRIKEMDTFGKKKLWRVRGRMKERENK
jgi:hypothetical protein